MKDRITVRIPFEGAASYTLFARGFCVEKPVYSEEKKGWIFSFSANKAAVLFYNFENFRRAFIVTGIRNAGRGRKLPGIEEKVTVIASLIGTRIEDLRWVISQEKEDDEYEFFRFPVLFWYRLSSLMDRRKNRRSAALSLIYRYRKEEYGKRKENNLCSAGAS